MRRSGRPGGLHSFVSAAAFVLILIGVGASLPAQQVVPGTNVNIVSGTTFPDGDPYLQRQNEPSGAVSTRNPLHILVGANDYRTVDIPHPSDILRPQKMNSDAWVSIFRSVDGGQNWKSTLIPGYPQDPQNAAPLYGYDAATDPVMRAATNGLFYFAGLAFDRGDNAPSAMFVARFIDMNNVEAGDPIVHLNTRIADSDLGARFLDKPALATDIARNAATCSFNVPLGDAAGTVVPQTVPAGPVYLAYSSFTGTGATEQSEILFTRSLDCGMTWSAPKSLSSGSRHVQNAAIAVNPANGHVYISWRRFKYTSQDDAIMVVRSTDGGATFNRAVRVSGVRPFDQGTTFTSFRTNGFQTTAFDAAGRVYLAWTERGRAVERPDPVTGDARIVISTSTNGTNWTVPYAIQPAGRGHQVMPALTFHAGKLRLLYYDLREDVSQIFAPFVDEFDIAVAGSPVRHTLDVFVAQALPGAAPAFTTAKLSDYATGFLPGTELPEQLQFNPPNLPLFRLGSTPFMGDYIDLAPAAAYVQNPDGTWSHNTTPGTAVSHAFWTDNRDVRPPVDGDWANYTPPRSAELGVMSRYDPTLPVPDCSPTHVGLRNQNIYTARVTEGLFVSAPGNNKPLRSDVPRAFVVVAENATALIRSFRLTIDNQPVGGTASFLQFSQLPELDVTVPPFSQVARSVFATSTVDTSRINVSIAEITAPLGGLVPGGLTGSLVLNPDPQAPRLQNPRLQNPRLQNPSIEEAEVYNAGITNAVFAVPRLQNPRLQNPSIENPRLQNDSLGNPRLQNDAVANQSVVSVGTTNTSIEAPRLQNPRLQNPRLQNETLEDAAFMDSSWVLTNDGNTTAAYTVNLVLNEPIPQGFASQLLIHKTTTTPAAIECNLAEQVHTALVANIPDPEFVPFSDVANPRLQNPRLQNPTLALAPGESATVTLRIVDLNKYDGQTYDASGAVTPAVVAQSVNTDDIVPGQPPPAPPVAVPLTITTTALPPTPPGTPFTRTLQTLANIGAVTCSLLNGTLPPGITLAPNGTLTGTPTVPGNYRFTVRCTDANGNVDDQDLFLQVDPIVPAGYDAVWNGADTDWSNPTNWSPRGVPEAADRVYVAASIPVAPKLTRDVTIRDLFVESGATIDTNGFKLTVTRNADAGRTIIGTGTTVLSGDGGLATGVFGNLEIAGRIILAGPLTATGHLTLGPGARLNLNGHSLIVGGQLITNVPTGALPVVSGPGGPFIAAGLAVNGLVLENAPLTINAPPTGTSLTQFDRVSFAAFAPEVIQLTVNHPGLADSFTMSGISFSTTPTTGRLVQANDTVADANLLVLDIFGGVPADGSSSTQTTGGAVVNWIFNPGDANLAVVQSVSPVPAVSGSVLTYTITVTNGGPATATGVTLSPGVPFNTPGVVTTTSQGTCTNQSGAISCALGTIPEGGAAVVTAAYAVTGSGTVLRTATVSGDQPDSVPGNNSHTVAATLVAANQAVSLSLAKVDSADPVVVNTPFTYTLTVTNTGTTTATNVAVVDPVPAGLAFANTIPSQGTCSVVAGQAVCLLGSLAPAQSATITIAATAPAAGLVTNSATVASSEIELTPFDNSASQSTMVEETAQCAGVTFTGPVSFQGSPGPMAVVKLVDMDHDGDLDAVATHENNPGGVDVFLNDGTGQFAAPKFTSTETGPWLHVVADFNGDTHPDVITATDRVPGGQFITLRLLTNDGTGTLTLVPTFSIPFGGSHDAQDLDRDGDMDLIIASATSDDVLLLRNDGAANFAAPVTIVSGLGGFASFGDLNGDNRTDAIVPAGAAGYAVVLADANGGFQAPVIYPVAAGASIVHTPTDLNGDGHLDLLIAEGEDEDASTGTASVAFGDGSGGFSAPVTAVSGGLFFFPILADLNGDGRMDIVGLSSFNGFGVWLGDGSGGFGAPVQFANATYYWQTTGDVNGDGRPEIVTGDRHGQLNVFFNNCGAAPANLSVALTESADPVTEGDELTYTVTVTNQTGTPATGVRLRSVLSPTTQEDPEEPNVEALGITSSAGGTLATAGSTYTWDLPTLAGNGTATFQFRFRPLGGAVLSFAAAVTSDGAETDPADNAAYVDTTVTPTSRQIVVTNTNDSGPGSLRQAIIESNDPGDVDTIVFDISPAGPKTIIPLSPLPTVDAPAIIDGTTQPGFAGAPIVELNGNGLAAEGLELSGNVTVRGLVINRFGRNGLFIFGNGNVIEGNYIGLDLTGTLPRPNGNIGIFASSANNRIGGATAQARNVISGNVFAGVTLSNPTATGNVVEGNYLGTTASGTEAVPNQTGVSVNNGASNNTVRGNVISGNGAQGVGIFGTGTNANTVVGNFIGTDPNGTVRVANGSVGVDVANGSGNIIGTVGAGRNVIAGNTGAGIQMRNGATGTLVRNNHIGVNAAGTASISNNVGIAINNSATANTIGGATADLRNVVAGNAAGGITMSSNASANVIEGNYIGTNAAGTGALGNGTGAGVVVNAPNNRIGGTVAGQRNVISGHSTTNGVTIANAAAVNNLVQGNYIGIDATGTIALPNLNGVLINNNAAGTIVEANVISGNSSVGVSLNGNASGVIVRGNTIGLNAAGTSALSNTGAGIGIGNVAGATIGGTTTAARNVISGNGSNGVFLTTGAATGNTIRGNYIGTNPAGTAALPNANHGISIGGGANGNFVELNLISGNTFDGVFLTGQITTTNNRVTGNLIGTNAEGTGAIPNRRGVSIDNAPGNTIGGTTSADRNIISGNTLDGLTISGAGASGNVVLGNSVGTNLAGTAAVPNQGHGLAISGSPNNVIGGTLPGAGNLISGNAVNGIGIFEAGATGNRVEGNRIGANATGNGVIPNVMDGVGIVRALNNTIGGPAAGAGNIIVGNGRIGVGIFEAAATGNAVQGNFIGTTDGTTSFGNVSDGVHVSFTASNNTIGGTGAGQGNTIAFNTGNGVSVFTGTGNRISSNRIFSNGSLGIDLGLDGVTNNDATDADTGPNNLQNHPVLTSATAGPTMTVQGTLTSAATTTFRIEFFSGGADPSGFGEGATPLGSLDVTTNASGAATFTANVLNTGTVVTATATDPNGNTSEFSTGRAVAGGPQTFVVSNTNDSGAGSLRQAITDANASASTLDTINFSVAGTGPHSIALLSPLPQITDSVVINGTSEPDFAGSPIVELNGAGAGAGTVGLNITAGNSTVRGLVINRFSGPGIAIATGNGNTITGNYIGTDLGGAIARPNAGGGISINTSNNTIGGATAALRNIISGNQNNGIGMIGGSGNVIRGNYIGLDVTGTAALSNGTFGISLLTSTANTIGGIQPGEGNIVAASVSINISVQSGSNDNFVQGNRVGTNAAGTAAVGPNGSGIYVLNSTGNRIGGTVAGARNVVAGNSGTAQVALVSSTNNIVQGNYIGTNAAGSAAITNGTSGIQISNSGNNGIGGFEAGAGNVISGNAAGGVVLFGSNANNIMGNLIGTAADGVASVPNTGNGITFNTTSTGNFVGSIAPGAGNVIAFNTQAGVSVATGAQNHLRSNRIFSNGGLGIDLGTTGVTANDTNDTDTGANNLQNFPVLTSAVANGTNTTIQGTLNSTPNATFVIEFFEGGADPSGFGEGAIPLGRLTVVTDGTGNVSFTATVANATASVTATATDVPGNTSEFSAVRALTVPPQTFTVSNLNDSGAGSLRQAIVSANASTGTLDTIAFSTTGTIALQAALPIISDSVIIDGTTAPGFIGQPVVEINGSLLPDPYGLHITAGNSTVRGLVISGFGARAGSTNGIGIVLENFGNNVVEGNYIGTDLTGQVAKGNLSYGVFMDGDNNRIGGTTAAARNVISGNMASGVGMNSGANNNIVQGNFIGLDRTGTADLGNGLHGINAFSSSSNTIGGPASSDRNVISGNSGHGILLSLANNNTILGNYIGTNSAGTADRGNGQDGVNVQGNNNTVGGTAPGAGNVVSGNNQVGISVQNGSTNSIIGNQIGVNAAGGAALANSSHGVTVVAAATGTVIQGNVISGNTVGGVFLSGSSGSVVQNNFIGTASDGTTLIANQANGVFVSSSSSNTIGKTAVGAGTGNVIAGNGLRGIAVQPPATNNVILGNAIFSNGALGIDLGNNGVTPNDTNDTDTGANNLQNFPALTSALLGGTLEIAGSLNSVLGRPYVLEFFRSASCDSLGFGEGQVFLGQTVLGATSQLTTPFTASFPGTGIAAGQYLTATATSSDGTSEFSQCFQIPAPIVLADLSITKTDSADPVIMNTPFAYTLTVQNLGPANATGVIVSDGLPSGMTASSAVSSKGSCGIEGESVSCNVGAMAASETVTITLTVSAGTAGLNTNIAEVSADQDDPDTLNNIAIQTTMVQAFAACAAPTVSGPTVYPAGATGFSLAAGDVNKDGATDLVALDGSASTVSLLLSNGAGGFSAPTPVTVAGPASGAGSATIVDVNHDGNPDLVVGNSQALTITTALGDGVGGFAHTFTSAALPSQPGQIQTGDFNEDGHVDLVVQTSPNLVMLSGDGTGAFGSPAATTIAGTLGWFVGHFSPDNHLDIVIGSSGSSNVIVYTGNGLGGFANAVQIPTSAAARVSAVGDVNGDGRTDVMLSDVTQFDHATVLFGIAAGFLGNQGEVGTGMQVVAIVDVNGDGRADAAGLGSGLNDEHLRVALGNGNGGFAVPVRLAASRMRLTGDFNADGRVDFVDRIGGSVATTVGVLLNACGQPEANLSVTLADSGDPVAEGAVVTLTATVTNNATIAATDVRLSANMSASPAGSLTVSPLDASCVLQSDGRYLCALGSLAGGATRTVEFQATPGSGGTINTVVDMTSAQADPNPSDNTDSETTVVTAVGRTIVVTNTNSSGPGSLAQAITDSNRDTNDVDRIVFNIPGGTQQSIGLTSALPAVTTPTTIDGTTQPGFFNIPVIELNGVGIVVPSTPGLQVMGGGTTVRALVINRFTGDGILISGPGGNVVTGSYIGLGLTGAVDLGNGGSGVAVSSSNGNLIGGAGLGNVIAGNTGDGVRLTAGSTGNAIQGNYIGLDRGGNNVIPNNAGVFISSAPGNTVGGVQLGAGNVISGNAGFGILVTNGASTTNIQGNLIGLNASGNADRGNNEDGIRILGSSGVVIGGTTAAARNVVSGNNQAGIVLNGSATTGAQIRGNYIGTRVDGGAGIGNSTSGVSIENGANGATVGGTGAGAGNLVSGNGSQGIQLVNVSNTLVQGNRIGTDDAATTNIDNNGNGVAITDGSNNTIGGTTAAARNIISGNSGAGVNVTASVGTASGNVVQNNYIGTNGSGTTSIRNLLSGVFVNGATNALIVGNVLSGNQQNGVRIFGGTATGTRINGNLIGTNTLGTGLVPNGFDGIRLDSTNGVVIGTPAAADRNLIGGNAQHGIGIYGAASGTVIQGNTIGGPGSPNHTGNSLDGVHINNGSNNLIGGTFAGDANIISFNGRNGVVVLAGTGNAIFENLITNNSALGIDLGNDGVTANDAGDGDTGPNNLQNFPVLTTAPDGVQIVFNGLPNTQYRMDFFENGTCDASGNGEGATFLTAAAFTTDANGSLVFSSPATPGQLVTATATDPANNTSEFSACVPAGGPGLMPGEHLWTGAVDTNWSNPGNWSPAGEPTATEHARISASAPQTPALTADTTVTHLFVEPGAAIADSGFTLTVLGNVGGGGFIDTDVLLAGQGTVTGFFDGDLETSGNYTATGSLVVSAGLEVIGGTFSVGEAFVNADDFETEGDGRLIMDNPLGWLQTADAMFRGGVSTLTAGTIYVTQDFEQQSVTSPQSFIAASPHAIVFIGAEDQRIQFESPEAAFGDLHVQKPSGTTAIESDVRVSGTLYAVLGLPAQFVGTGQLISANGLNVGGAVFDNVRLLAGPVVGTFDHVTFINMAPTATQLTFAHPGTPPLTQPLRFGNVRFLSTPTTGLYIQAEDTAPADGVPLVVTMDASQPLDGSAFTATAGGAIVNWINQRIRVVLVGAESVAVGSTATLRVTLPTPAPAGGAVVDVISLFTQALSVAAPGQISIPAGQSVGEIQVTAMQPGLVSVYATSPAYVFGGLTIPVGYSLTVPAAVKVGVGLQRPATVSIGNPSNTGMFVEIRSSDPAVALVSSFENGGGQEIATLFIPDGSTSAEFWVVGVGEGTAIFTASAELSLTGLSSVETVQPALQIENLPPSIAATAASVPFIVSMGVATPDGSSLAERQTAVGFNPISFTVSNSNAGVAQLVTLAGGAQSGDVSIGFGEQASPSTLVAGGIEFDPLSPGQTTVTVTGAGFLTTTAGSVTVNVTNGLNVVFQHVGAANPTTEGFASDGGSTGTPIVNDGGTGLDAWRTTSASTTSGFHYAGLDQAQRNAALANGWKVTSRARIESGIGHVNLDVGTRRFDMHLYRDANGDTVAQLSTTIFPFAGMTFTLVGSGSWYHTYDLLYDPATQRANLFIDGILRISNYAGHTQFASGLGLMFGAAFANNANGVVFHNLARLQIF